MVYGGRPSRGCRTCRTRRIKVCQLGRSQLCVLIADALSNQCDEGKPTCKQCAKSKRECGGYRSEFEIVHRDQTRSTVRRMRRALDVQHSPVTPTIVFVHEQPQLPSPRPSPPRHEPQQRRLPTSSTPSPPPVLAVPVAQRAACYFASNFILMPLGQIQHGYMEYLLPLIESAPPDSALSHAFNACAFASLGNRVRADSVDFTSLSLKQHTLALARTHVALGDAKTARTDATLAAILLLSMYEGITAIKSTRMLAWRSHIDGAVDIVKARGREQMCSTKIGAHLFHSVRQQLISRTLSAGAAPPGGADWWAEPGPESIFAACHRFALTTGEIRARTTGLLANSGRDSKSIEQIAGMARRIHELDHEIASWLISVPSEYRFHTICWVDQQPNDMFNNIAEAEAFPGRVDVYPDFVTAGAWNVARISRLILASVGIRIAAWLCSPMDYRTTAEYATWKHICEGTIAEVISSVPYHLGWHTKQRELFQNSPNLSGFACGEQEPFKALPAYLLVWALACLKNHDLTHETQRAWVKARLKFIEEQVGIKYARIINEVDIRFPSMLIRQDGQMRVPDAFRNTTLRVLSNLSSTSEDLPPVTR
ncbi:hypothetical protein QBC47DRAFT_289621 [Echria macrotheca]|uniref:Zn(2)-C6 fungal-type domain-containing protein n=1 Tax=Echria macrotheca TaxID=438768 RepID=A0AAJ0FGW6_9PEZI|nr:hypothetical protein QBC47DRAFT_289621 [Echria macrotheca]